MISALLVNSPLFREPVAAIDEDYLPSIGLGILARAARDRGIAIEYIDAIFEKRGVTDIAAVVEQGQYDVVGLNIFTVNQHLVREIVERVRRRVTFVVGGLSAGALFASICEWQTKNPIHVVFGDGEIIFPLLITEPDCVKSDGSAGHVRYYEISRKSPYYVADISSVFPARDLFRNEPYKNIHDLWEACIVTSRGCIYNCAFCAAAISVNQSFSVRESTVESVQTDIRAILERSRPVQSIRILDDLYLKNRNSIKRASTTFSKFALQWRAMAHVASIKQTTEDDLGALRASGCTELFVGIESGSPRVLKRIHKTSDAALIREQMTRLFACGITAKCYFILGFPDETLEDMHLTVALARDLRDAAARYNTAFRTSVFQFRPYHGTELFHDLTEGHAEMAEKDARFDSELTEKIGRSQYNFEAGNFSAVPTDQLRELIVETAALKTPN